MNRPSIRILVADDHPVVRDGLAAMLGTQPDLVVVGQASTGLEAIQQVLRLKPDVVLLDLEMPEMDGVEAIRQLSAVSPETRTIVFTAFDTGERIVGAVQAGAKGYLLKGTPRDELFNAIRLVRNGGSLLQPIIASKLMQQLSGQPADILLPIGLTEREAEVLQCLGQGKSNKEIATALNISERTVKFHMSSILGKLGADNRTEAVTIAMQRGLIHLA